LCLAIDIDASSGRAILGSIAHPQLKLAENHCFNNQPVIFPDGLHWNALSLHQEYMCTLFIIGIMIINSIEKDIVDE
jgi:hypothetical protein